MNAALGVKNKRGLLFEKPPIYDPVKSAVFYLISATLLTLKALP